MKKLYKSNELLLVLIICAISIGIGVFNTSFFTLENFLDLFKTSSFIGILAIGVFVVLLSGGIDLSFTAVATVAMYLMGSYMLAVQGNIYVSFIIVVAVGIGLGTVNALLIHYLKIQAIIITLGTLNAFWGALMFLSNGRDIYNLPKWFTEFAKINFLEWRSPEGSLYGLSIFIILWAIVIVITGFISRYTMIGRGVQALGGGMQAASRAGFNIFKIHLFTYCYAGMLAGVASVVHVGLVDQIAPHAIVGKELVVIAAVVLGGASLLGGSGTLLGTILGVILISVIANGLTLMRLPSYWHGVFTGLVLLISIYLTARRQKAHEREIVRVNVE